MSTLLRTTLIALAILAAPAVYAKQVCVTQALGNDDFNGIDGSSDSHVIAVGKDGVMARYDGSNWTSLPTLTNKVLFDVHVVSPSVGFAVGKDGALLQQNGAAWSVGPVLTNEDLRGVWAASATQAWAVGKKGEIYSYDGTSWTDQSAASGASNKDMEDAWGDASAFYALNDSGDVHRYDRLSGTWDAPDTTCAVANGFDDIWGDASGRLFLVRKKEIYRHDGASCTLIGNASEDLRGVSGSAATGEVYAVGKKGAVMYYNGAAWQETQVGNEEFRDDWVSTIGNAYYAAKKGELTTCQKVIPKVVGDWHFDDCTLDLPGSIVLDSSGNGLDGVAMGGVSLETDGQLCPAVALDGNNGYVAIGDAPLLDLTEGVGFALWLRHNASTPTDWEAIFAKGDSAFRLHLNGGCTIADTLPGNARLGITMGLNGGCGGADLNSNVVPTPGVWYHVAGTYDRTKMHLYINGMLVNSADYTAAINSNNFDLFIGENSQNRGRYWDGDIDELTLWDEAIVASEVTAHMNRTRPCDNCSVAEFVVTHDNSGIHCLDENIRIDVVDSLAGTPRIDYNAQVTLNTGNGAGTWALVSGSGTFADSTGGDGLATYDWPLGESFAEFALTYPAGPAAVNVDVFQTSDVSIRDQDGEGNLVFAPSGFTLTGAPLSNPPPASITPFSGPRIAGTDMPLYLTAFGQTATDPQCGVIETYTGAKSVKFWSDYGDPGTGSLSVGIDGVAVATAEAFAATQAIAFVSGQAAVTAKYKDAGRIQILVKDDTLVHPDLPNGIRGATTSFVSRPDRFLLSAIEDSSGNPNPAAANAAGPRFVAAGEAFEVTVTALDAEGDATPNFGQESIAETVALTTALVAPGGGNNPPLSAGAGFGAFSGGTATGTDFRWPEVGIITLMPAVGDGSYLTAGDVGGPTSANVGRFVPNHFSLVSNAPAFATACGSGGYTYIGESFDYSIAPQITVTAQSSLSTVTQNYTGAFFKIDNGSLANRAYTAAAGTLDTSGVPGTAVDPAVADIGGGVGTLTFNAGTGLLFTRSVPESPFDADITLSIDVADHDAVTATVNPAVFGAAGGITFDGGAAMRYGRALLTNAVGSELMDLPVPLATEYFADAVTGFVPHVADACTAALPLTLASFAGALGAGETCVQDAGTPGVSGAGCAAPALPGARYRASPLAGDFNLFLAAPGAGNGGSVTVIGDAPGWLEYDWDASLPGFEDPAGIATFGVFSGNARRIYLREVY